MPISERTVSASEFAMPCRRLIPRKGILSCGGIMHRIRKQRQRAQAFVSGNYPGAPVDYIMALMTTGTLMIVTVLSQLL